MVTHSHESHHIQDDDVQRIFLMEFFIQRKQRMALKTVILFNVFRSGSLMNVCVHEYDRTRSW
jgi:hypothetical protein